MARLLGVIILAVAGWAVWSYVLRPALQPPARARQAAAMHATATPRPVPAPVDSGPAADRARHFLAAWADGHYDQMYDDLSPSARQAISRTAFIRRYTNIAAAATIASVRPTITGMAATGDSATVTYTVAMSTIAVGPVSDGGSMTLRAADGHWGIDWTPDLIFHGLGKSYLVHLFTAADDTSELARRGAIVDRLGQPLALQGLMKGVDVVPADIHDEQGLLRFLSGWLGRPAAAIQATYRTPWYNAHTDEAVPIATVTSLQWASVPVTVQVAQQNNGLMIVDGASRRLYPHGALAAPLLGYVASTDGHGVTGLERWADGSLTGQDGARLVIATAPDYAYPIRTIKDRPKRDGATVHLTIDTALQQAAEQALAGKVGSVVALRPSDGAVLAMASTPGYDPNLFAAGIGAAQYKALVDDPRHPFLNRAATGAYPLGSVFKMVTLGAALEKLHDTISTTIPGPPIWYGLPGYPMHDWSAIGHGIVTLHEALVQSCDTCFYQIGQQLDNTDHNLLPDYARAWGFGAPTGIVGVREASGAIPDPHYTLTQLGKPWIPGDAVNMAIGQGYVQVTPLQAAQMLAALGNNGVMYRPRVVDKIVGPDGATLAAYSPAVARTLPLNAGHVADILRAMRGVVAERSGTAWDKFVGFGWPVAGKTGTAQSGDGRLPHAWFAALAPADHPNIALVVMVEHGGEGADFAAPLARQILQTFFTRDGDLAVITPAKGPAVLPVP